MTRTPNTITSKIKLLLCATASWYIVAYLISTPYLIPYPHEALLEVLSRPRLYFEAELYTATEAVIGLGLAVFGSLLLSVIIFFWPTTESYIMPSAIAMKATPIIAIAPLLAVWFGPGLLAKVLMSALISFFPVLQNVTDALKSAPREIRFYTHVLGATRYRDLRYVRMWLALPAFASGLKVAAPLAVVGAMVSEFLGADNGVGHLMFIFVSKAQTKEIFAAILSVIVIGWTLYFAMFLFERSALDFLKLEQETEAHEQSFV
jgi:NitT/TauT family transport system permease protein